MIDVAFRTYTKSWELIPHILIEFWIGWDGISVWFGWLCFECLIEIEK
jgi:hypothetical protein